MLRLHKPVRPADRLVSLSKTGFLVRYKSHGHGTRLPWQATERSDLGWRSASALRSSLCFHRRLSHRGHRFRPTS